MITSENMSGKTKAAVFLLALGEDISQKVLSNLDQLEIIELSSEISKLKSIPGDIAENVCREFLKSTEISGTITGGYDTTERLLHRLLPPDQVNRIMEEIRGPAGLTMWDKLDNVSESVLVNYLKNEYPQTVAVILTKLKPFRAAQILSSLPEDFSIDIITRMIHMDTVQKDILDRIEGTLRHEFISNLSQSPKRDSYEVLADIFNNFERRKEVYFMSALEDKSQEDAERIKSMMFTFEDIRRLPKASIVRLLREADREKLPTALKGSSDEIRKIFFSSMTSRAARMLEAEISAIGPVRVKDVDTAQAEIIKTIKNLMESGEIENPSASEDSEFVF
ncbi:MAG: flagellar motor switch protein FliG [Acetobacter sp.]|jgi:flagellar motor switch protein FliG|nr:flagellar motor switch protein FliG [Acetobacter sp.]MCH4061133.1 flagellar motor switch protein FliG [Acetobacter sp.]MCH4088071.1 flagellar motor switch protein FliG [Acetobacter sp.]MCI1293315.1 flagellar motor switch protein FliG [Acetobacter sp.]MCI1320060.1 flagellar motor switch protein FliG [Acetobacter sp.]